MLLVVFSLHQANGSVKVSPSAQEKFREKKMDKLIIEMCVCVCVSARVIH